MQHPQYLLSVLLFQINIISVNMYNIVIVWLIRKMRKLCMLLTGAAEEIADLFFLK